MTTPNKSDSLISINDDDLFIGRNFRMTAVGMEFSGQPTIQAAEHCGHALGIAVNATGWALGDFANYIEEHFGEEASQILDAERFSESTLSVYRWVAKAVPLPNRRADLEFSHHQLVAKLSHKEQKEWLARAAEGDGDGRWSVKRLKQELTIGGASVPRSYYVIVDCKDKEDQEALIRQLSAIGREPRKIVGPKDKKAKKPKKAKSEPTVRPKRSKQRKGAKH